MFLARFDRTMRNVVPVEDTGIDITRPLKGYTGPRRLVTRVRHVEPISRPVVKKAVPLRPLEFMREVAERNGLTVADIMGKRRKRRIIAARREAIYLVWLNCRFGVEQRRYSLPEIGRVFGLDHTTVLHHLKAMGVGSVAA
jgi:hypothetical protein